MKSKIDLTETFDDCTIVARLCLFLGTLSIKSGDNLSDEVYDIQQHQFCGDCQNLADDCGCNGRYRAEYDDGADYED